MKSRLKTLAYSMTVGLILLTMTVVITGCDEDDDFGDNNSSRCPSGMSNLGKATDDYTCLSMCSRATAAGKTAIWHRTDNQTCCCTK
jgi:hypothetical protein